MKMFERPDSMRYKWTDEWCDTFDQVRRMNRKMWCYIPHRDKWRQLDVPYSYYWEANHISQCNDRQYADEISDYLVQGLDENSVDQPFLPKKPFMVARARSLRECVRRAMHSRILIDKGRELHHMTIKSLTTEYDRWPIDSCLKYVHHHGDTHVWYVYGGRILKVSSEDTARLMAVDEIYLNSPEFKRAFQYV